MNEETAVNDAASRQAVLSDDHLCDGLAAGSPWAGDALYERVADIVAAALFHVAGPTDHDRDDMIQQTLEKVVRTVISGQFGRRCSLKTWASMIAKNVAFDAFRGRTRERTVLTRAIDSGMAEELVMTNRETPERAVELSQRVEKLRAALAATRHERAEAVLLHDVLGHELTEIARMTGVSVAAAQSRLVRGRKDIVNRMMSAEGSRRGGLRKRLAGRPAAPF